MQTQPIRATMGWLVLVGLLVPWGLLSAAGPEGPILVVGVAQGDEPQSAQKDEEPKTSPAEPPTGPTPPARQPDSAQTKLVGKKVVVHLRDGSVRKGKLLDVTEKSLEIKTKQGREQLPLDQVAFVEPKRSKWLLPVAIVSSVAAAVLVLFVIGASSD